MKNKGTALVLAGALTLAAQQWQIARPGYRYEFPRDHFCHPDYQTEWWYYTGNLKALNGRRFGFELTFFRVGIHLSAQQRQSESRAWAPDEIYLAHLALSDIDGRHFYHTERLNRGGPGLAGASLPQRRIWNGNWQVSWTQTENHEQQLQAVSNALKLELRLTAAKPPVINGRDGVSIKGPAPGDASQYISVTRLSTTGTLGWQGQVFTLQGLAWMDHEFFTSHQGSNLSGWDWFAIQLDNNEELMLYRLRRKPGTSDEYSSGTYVDDTGRARFLSAHDFSVVPGGYWSSSASHARYPLKWQILVPSLHLQLTESTALPDQELVSKDPFWPTYWEGAVQYAGEKQGRAVTGAGYLEMTGYAGSGAAPEAGLRR